MEVYSQIPNGKHKNINTSSDFATQASVKKKMSVELNKYEESRTWKVEHAAQNATGPMVYGWVLQSSVLC